LCAEFFPAHVGRSGREGEGGEVAFGKDEDDFFFTPYVPG
jgi:hypothetical protein